MTPPSGTCENQLKRAARALARAHEAWIFRQIFHWNKKIEVFPKVQVISHA